MTNPITIDHTILRQNILPGLLRLLVARHHDLPQGVYELGSVVIDHANRDRFAFLVAENSGGFAALRGRIQALMRDLGCTDWSLEPIESGPWLTGRAANIVVKGTVVGECEIDPHVSEAFELNVPMSGAQFDVSSLSSTGRPCSLRNRTSLRINAKPSIALHRDQNYCSRVCNIPSSDSCIGRITEYDCELIVATPLSQEIPQGLQKRILITNRV